MKNEGNILKVVQLGLENKVYEAMRKPNFSVEALTRQLNSESVAITAQSIRKFIKKTKKAQQELIAKDLSASREIKNLTMDYTNAMKEILKEVEEVKNTVKEEKDYTAYNQLVGRLMQGIELVAKITGDMKPKESIDINIIFNEINHDIENRMKNLKTEMFKGKIVDVDIEIESEENKKKKQIDEND